MSVFDDIESMEEGLLDSRHSDHVMDVARSVEHLFDEFSDAVEYAQAYDDTYDRRSTTYDPEAFAEYWEESFDGDMSGITDELMYGD